MSINQKAARALFSLPEDVIYLNGAYMSPNLKKVEEAGLRAIQRKNYPGNYSIDDFFKPGEELRQLFAQLIGAKTPNRIAIIPSVSYGMANAANNISLHASDEILIVSEQFPSNYYIWERRAKETEAKIKIITPPESDHRSADWNQRILDSINTNTKVVSMSQVHWADGTLYDLVAIQERIKSVGGYLILDLTQSLGALPFSLDEIKADVVICAAYKWLLGPYSIGAAYYSDRFDNGTPIEESWINRLGSEDFSQLVNYQSAHRPGARKYEVGEASNFFLLPMMIEGLKQIIKWGPKNIQEYTAKISKDCIQNLRKHGYTIEDDQYRAKHLFGIRFPANREIEKIKASLEKYKIKISFRGDAARVSPNVYNSEDDFSVLLDCLTK